MRKALVVMMVACLAGFAASAIPTPGWEAYMQELAEKAKAEGGVIFTYGMPETWANYGEIFRRFEELYGIVQHDIDMGSSVVLARMTEENASKNDLADLKPTLAAELARRGLTSDYQCSCWDLLPESQRGVDPVTGSVWYAAYWGSLGFLVNIDLVKPVPRSWKDLLNPAYKGLIEYLDPRFTGTGINTIEAAALAMSGDPYNYKAGVDFFKKLHDMGLIGSVDPLVTVARFQRGETGILINFDYNLLKWKEENPQINAVVIIPEDGTVATGGGVVMARNAPHPWTARLFLEYLLCGEGQILYAKAFVHPMNPTVQLPPEILEKFPPKEAYKAVVFIDYAKEAEIIFELQEYYSKTIFGG